MTCIAAAIKNGKAYIGCDSLISGGDRKISYLCKIVHFQGFSIGLAGSLLGFHVLEEISKKPSFKKAKVTNASEARAFGRRFFYALKKEYVFFERDDIQIDCSHILIVTPNAIYQVDNAVTCITSTDYMAMGSGEPYGLPIMRALWDIVDDPKLIVEKAIDSASHYSLYCGGPSHIFEVEAPPPRTGKKKPIKKKKPTRITHLGSVSVDKYDLKRTIK